MAETEMERGSKEADAALTASGRCLLMSAARSVPSPFLRKVLPSSGQSILRATTEAREWTPLSVLLALVHPTLVRSPLLDGRIPPHLKMASSRKCSTVAPSEFSRLIWRPAKGE